MLKSGNRHLWQISMYPMVFMSGIESSFVAFNLLPNRPTLFSPDMRTVYGALSHYMQTLSMKRSIWVSVA